MTKTARFDTIALDADYNMRAPTVAHAPQLIRDHHGAAQGRSSPTASAASEEHEYAATSRTDAAHVVQAATSPTPESNMWLNFAMGRPASKGEAWKKSKPAAAAAAGGDGGRRRPTMVAVDVLERTLELPAVVTAGVLERTLELPAVVTAGVL